MYPNTSNSVKKTRLRLVFSTHFSGFGYPDETLFLVFDILLNTRPILVVDVASFLNTCPVHLEHHSIFTSFLLR